MTEFFKKVVAIDFSSKLLENSLKLQSLGTLEIQLISRKNNIIKMDIRSNLNAAKVIFKQMTWIPNELPKSHFVLFTMIDRVTNHLCKYKNKTNFNFITTTKPLFLIQHGLNDSEK